jgi:hypothetical protein
MSVGVDDDTIWLQARAGIRQSASGIGHSPPISEMKPKL